MCAACRGCPDDPCRLTPNPAHNPAKAVKSTRNADWCHEHHVNTSCCIHGVPEKQREAYLEAYKAYLRSHGFTAASDISKKNLWPYKATLIPQDDSPEDTEQDESEEERHDDDMDEHAPRLVSREWRLHPRTRRTQREPGNMVNNGVLPDRPRVGGPTRRSRQQGKHVDENVSHGVRKRLP